MREQVRGSTTPCEEQAYILRHSRSSGLVIQDATSLQVQPPPPPSGFSPSFTPLSGLPAEIAAELFQFLFQTMSPSINHTHAHFSSV